MSHSMVKNLSWKCWSCLALIFTFTSVPAQEEEPKMDTNQMMAEMMAKAAKYTKPGEAHKLLEKMLGSWETDTRITMPGSPDTGEKGKAEISWMMPGRWIKNESSGTFLGQPAQSISIMGYDNFKQSYVATTVSSVDTAMNRVEGDMDPGGKVLLLYGTIDEYLTGEHDKMIKVVYRFLSDDEFLMELHDLPIGENNTKVVEIRYTRAKLD